MESCVFVASCVHVHRCVLFLVRYIRDNCAKGILINTLVLVEIIGKSIVFRIYLKIVSHFSNIYLLYTEIFSDT